MRLERMEIKDGKWIKIIFFQSSYLAMHRKLLTCVKNAHEHDCP